MQLPQAGEAMSLWSLYLAGAGATTILFVLFIGRELPRWMREVAEKDRFPIELLERFNPLICALLAPFVLLLAVVAGALWPLTLPAYLLEKEKP
jgi:hypothetical protein